VDLRASAKIEGEESQIATITLKPGQTLRAESGSMIYMTEGVEMETSSDDVSSAMKRLMTGQNLFVTDFSYQGQKEGIVALGTDFPSKILRLHLPDYPHQTLVCQKGAYLASNPNVTIEMAFTKNFSSGFFGGQGFVLQKLQGDGDVLVKAGGTLVTKELKEGETLRVTSGCLVAFTATVDFGALLVDFNNYACFQCNERDGTHFTFVCSYRCSNDKGRQKCHFRRRGLVYHDSQGSGHCLVAGHATGSND
jgi:uncharacterized protein (TIGR00266 family)